MKIALAQINTTVGDFEGNKSLILEAYRKAVAQGAELVLTPELAITGYPPRDLVYRSRFVPTNKETLVAIAAEVGEAPLITGFVDLNTKGRGRPFRNAAAVLHKGAIVQVIYKTLLPTYDVFDEDRYFEPAESCLPVLINGTRLGVTVCEDIWTDEYLPEPRYDVNPPRKLAELGIDVLVNISASPFHLGKPAIRERMIAEVARELNAPVIYCNAVGGNDQLVFDGNSLVVDAAGEVVARMKSFAEDLAVVDVEVAPPFPHESARPLHLPPRDVKALKVQLKEVLDGDPMSSGRPLAQDLHDALVLGLRDYVHKCGFKSCVLGLSGGIDSALVAALAAEALGPENVLGVSLPSVFSSQGSKDDARDLAKNLGIRYETVTIQAAVESVKGQLGDLFAGRAEDITEENMQARIRGLLLMSISNKFGHLLLTTGNKSELAVGYCTIYGDMCGGLAVISDLPKTQVYAVSRWINRDREVIPWPSIEKPPSAELKPNQKDQDTLPEYDVLDAILYMFLERGMNAKEIAAAGHDEELVRWVLRRVDANEWKRHQAAPGLKVTSKAFGIGRRIPIAQRFKIVGIVECAAPASLPPAMTLADDSSGIALHASEPFQAPVLLIHELLVIDAQRGENGGMQIPELHGTIHGHEANLVRGAEMETGAHAAARHPDREAGAVVLAPEIGLLHGGAAKFAGPDDEGFIQHAGLLQVIQQGSDGLVHDCGVLVVIFLEMLMGVPAVLVIHVVELDETDAALHEAAGEQALAGKLRLGRQRAVDAVGLANVGGLLVEIADFKGLRLHAVGQFVGGDARIQFTKTGMLLAMEHVHFPECVQSAALGTGEFRRRREIAHKLSLATQARALESSGQESVAVVRSTPLRAGFKEEDVAGQILILRPQAVSHPGAEAGFATDGLAGVKLDAGGCVVVALRLHGMDEAEIIHMPRHVGEEFRDPGTALAILTERIRRRHEVRVRSRGGVRRSATLGCLHGATLGHQLRHPASGVPGFVVKSVDAGRAADHEEEDDRLGLRRESGPPSRAGRGSPGPPRVESRGLPAARCVHLHQSPPSAAAPNPQPERCRNARRDRSGLDRGKAEGIRRAVGSGQTPPATTWWQEACWQVYCLFE